MIVRGANAPPGPSPLPLTLSCGVRLGPDQLFRMSSKMRAAPEPLDGVNATETVTGCRPHANNSSSLVDRTVFPKNENGRSHFGYKIEWLPPSPDGIVMCLGHGVEHHAAERTAR
jgi:hypothetical protein